MFVFWNFYFDRTEPFCSGFSAIENLYVTLYRSDVIGIAPGIRGTVYLVLLAWITGAKGSLTPR